MTRWRVAGIGRLAVLLCAVWLGAGDCWAASEFHARVYRIIDGDTVELRYDGRMQLARLRGIDAPELKQPYGPQAKRAVAAMVTGMVVRIRPYGTDPSGVSLVEIILQSGRSVSRSLLQEGFAWRRPDAAPDFELESAEADAQYSHRGLWSEPNPTAPWIYRASKSRARR